MIPPEDEIKKARAGIAAQNLRVRGSYKTTIDTKTLAMKAHPIIEVWLKQKRKYQTLMIGDVWRYDTDEERDAVLAALKG